MPQITALITNSTEHEPVLAKAVTACLKPEQGESYLDLTAGYGGHAGKIMEATLAPTRTVLVDRDNHAIKVLTETFPKETRILHMDYLSAVKKLAGEQLQFDMILADLGVSSPHLNDAIRGFAIKHDGPLDMRMDSSQELTAAQIVNTWADRQLIDILRRYGEEPKAARIAQLIVRNRPLATTTELAAIVARAYPGYQKSHPATRTFQALRIAVNDELTQLAKSLPYLLDLLAPGGRLAIISFHSLEDRIVKQFIAEHAGHRYDAELENLTKSPVTADTQEVVFNPRARSAKLRAASKK